MLLRPGFAFLCAKRVPENDPKITSKRPPKLFQKLQNNVLFEICLRPLFELLLDLILSSETIPLDAPKVDFVSRFVINIY